MYVQVPYHVLQDLFPKKLTCIVLRNIFLTKSLSTLHFAEFIRIEVKTFIFIIYFVSNYKMPMLSL